MIPKVIHYCWFSGEKKPRLVKRCIKSWKRMLPDYKIKCWDAHSFNFNSVQFVKQAYARKKWAFMADYIRLYALYTEGGIYLDSDVEVYKSFDEFLQYSFFTGTDVRTPDRTSFGVEAAIMGAEKGHPYLKECLEYYEQQQFINTDGSLNMKVMPDVITPLLQKYGYKYIDSNQYLEENITVFSSAFFANCNAPHTTDIYARHWNTNTWLSKDHRGRIYNFFYKHDLMFIYQWIEKILIKFRK